MEEDIKNNDTMESTKQSDDSGLGAGTVPVNAESGKRSWAMAVMQGRNREKTPVLPVLLVEDDKLMGRLLKTALERRGFTVAMPESLSEADIMAAIEIGQYSCVITDYRMPSCSGVEVLDIVRKIDDGRGDDKKTKVMIITSDDPDIVKVALREGGRLEANADTGGDLEVFSKLRNPIDAIMKCIQEYPQSTNIAR